jgi:hypothetical protein
MHSAVIPGTILLALLLGGPAVAQDAKQAPQTEGGKALADPDQQRQADEAMNTESGKAGKTEPSSHAPSGDGQVLEGGKLKPSEPTDSGRPSSARQ